mmetsp:Transcript_10050/g.15329  ORF Transcript_10050/g.15329 Transcript_10050/m.15329 type:complete len:97 (-) Transcript_10050:142-432(-)
MPQLDCPYLINILFKAQSFMNKKSMESHKHMVPRLQIVLTFLNNFGEYEKAKRITLDSFPQGTIIQMVANGIEAQAAEQRQVSLQLLVALNNQFGF